ncbi:hypothetical protein Zmor_001332 [Zophobas morio]|uniref:Tudor domain-containing protein n=1 Tax=Zophobas morio TaxID=2755281 RepID=A0AA38IYD6_9CUCU|nr:hypothetical protein Zmor_001332 [Zophobas morio]
MDPEVADLDVINTTLKSGIHRVTQLLNHFNMINTRQLNVRALFEEAQDVKDISCRLVSEQETLRPIEFVADVFEDIEDVVCLKNICSVEYSLLPIEDWSKAQEKFELEQIRRKSDSQKTEPIPEAPTAIVKSFKHVENQAKKFNEGKIRVVVTHINDLNSFYIQKYTTLDSLKEMNGAIGKRGRKRAGMEEFKKGGIYGVSYQTKNSCHWRRGKVIDIFNNGENIIYKVNFIDYGNSQNVTKDRLKELDLHTVKRPPFAFECKLTNPEARVFDDKVHLLLPQIIGQKELYLTFMHPQSSRVTVYEVELLVAASNGGFISVRDLLNNTSPLVPDAKDSLLLTELKLFKNGKRFTVGQEETVVVTYVRDPFYICVQLSHNVKILQKMQADLEKFYKDTPVISCIPVVDSDVIVKYSDEFQGNWHRAKIISVDVASKKVGVFFVDWGQSTVVSWSNLRLLTENFIKVECQGIIVKLSDIERLDTSQNWTEEATDFLREQLNKNKECRMVASGVEPLQVALFQLCPLSDICLNSLLVESEHAISTGTISQTVFWPHAIQELPQDDDDMSYQMMKKSEEVIMDGYEDIHLMTGLKLQVYVIRFDSPDLIYIKFAKYKETEDEMHKEMQIHYSKSKLKTRSSWKQGEHCIVFDEDHSDYFRAVIKSASDSNNYVVYLYDHVRELKVSKKIIFELDPYFRSYPCYICKCRLTNIRPAGDPGKWSHTAIEMLEKIFNTYTTFHVKKIEKNTNDKMIGVIMWYSVTTPAKALQPAKIKYVSINQSLLESGLAFSASSLTNGPSAGTEPNNCDDSDIEKNKKQNWYDIICEDERYKDADKPDMHDMSQVKEEICIITQQSWPKPFKFKSKEFDATLTCVVDQGIFLIRTEDVQNLYLDVETEMNDAFESATLLSNANSTWKVGDMCTIAYDGKWYRGSVLELLEDDTVSVEMVDFGSEHVVPIKSLYKNIMFPDIPTLVNKIQLYDVHSSYGHWRGEDVDKVLRIVTDQVRVEIKGDKDVEVPLAEIYLDNGLSLNDMITQVCPHMKRRECSVVLGSVDDLDVSVDDMSKDATSEKTSAKLNGGYTYVWVPSSFDEKQKMFVAGILKWDLTYNVVLSSAEDNTKTPEFIRLCETVQMHVGNQANLSKIEIDTACICLHPQKNTWCRAMVYNVDSLKFGFVLAFFVDYGMVEMVPISSLKEIRSDWLEFPVHMQIAAVNVQLLQNNQAEYMLAQLNNLHGKSVLVEVVTEVPLKVHLYDDKALCYQKFLDNGIMKAL